MEAKRFFLMLFVMLMSATGAWALDNVSYVDANDHEQTANNVTVINTSNTDQIVTWNAGWYVVQGNVTFSKGVICRGNVHLILADGAKLTVTGSDKNAGIQVNRGSATLTIYGQTAQSGSLSATGTDYGGAGIGGERRAGNGRIIINGGNITVRGGRGAAGIGGGHTDLPSVHPTGEDITINGGTVKAYGGDYAAGIGGGDDCDGKNITINGGKVTAIGGYYAAGIGGGYYGTASNITINGGDVFAQGGSNAIGCGLLGDAAKYVYVADGLYVRADNQNPPHTLITHTGITHDIASSLDGKAYVRISPDEHVLGVRYLDTDKKSKTTDALEVTNASEQVTWNNDWYVVYGNVTLSKGAICQGGVKLILADGATLTTTGDNNEAGIRVSGVGNSLTIYVQSAQTGQLIATGGANGAGIGGANGEEGSNITVLNGFVTATGGTNASAIGGGAGGSSSDIYVDDRRAVKVGNSTNPETEIIHTLTTDIAQQLAGHRYAKIAPGEYMYDVPYVDENGEVQTVERARFIYENISEPTTWTEGWYAVYGNVTYSKYLTCTGNIHLILLDGAKFTVSANENSKTAFTVSGSNPSLTIYGQSGQSGQLNATANHQGAGIDVGSGPITINGGTITATAQGSAGINGGKITINDGVVTANGSLSIGISGSEITINKGKVTNTAGIKGSNITINGGEVTSIPGYYSIGIGGNGSIITIKGGVISATGAYQSCGIRGGTIIIDGGKVTATGGGCAAGIGAVTSITINGGVVTAKGGDKGAGIGGGEWGEGYNITINGGEVDATGGNNGAGIGGGYRAPGHDITINGGIVTAKGGVNGAGIGGGVQRADNKNIFINGGTVTAIGGNDASCIGSGANAAASSDIYVSSFLSLKSDNTNPPTTEIAHTSNEDVAGKLNGKRYAKVIPHEHEYASEWQHDEHSHWHACISEIGTCTAPRGEEVAHCTPDILNDQANYHCNICGYTNETLKAQYDARDYMSMTAVGGDVTVGMAKTGSPDNYTIQMSADGNHWSEPQTLDATTMLATILEGETYYFRHGGNEAITRVSKDYNHVWTFTMTGNGTIEAGGNIMSLIDATCQQTEIPRTPNHVFTKLFMNCDKLTKAPELPATTVGLFCYVAMFAGTSISVAPALPATNIPDGAYVQMFMNCKNLVTVPALPGTQLERRAYDRMFNGCDKLTNIEIANIESMVVEEGETGREASFHDMLAGTAAVTNGVIIAPVDMMGDARITLPSNWQWATKLHANEDPTHGEEGNFYTTFYDSRNDYTIAVGHKAYSGSIEEIDGENELLLTPTPDNIIPKGNGVILHGGSGEVLLTVNNDEASTIQGNVLTGSDENTTAPENCYIMSYGQEGLGFYRYADGKSLAAHKAYMIFERSAEARSFRMVFADDEVDGIENINDNDTLRYDDDNIYSISGVRLNKLQKGINIVNGKKVIVK